MIHLIIGPFIFGMLGYLFHLVESDQILHTIFLYITLQELQAVAIMLHKMAFYVVRWFALHFGYITVKFIYIIKLVEYLLFFPD